MHPEAYTCPHTTPHRHTYTHTCVTDTHTHKHTHTHTREHTHTHTHTNKHTHTKRTHTYTHTTLYAVPSRTAAERQPTPWLLLWRSTWYVFVGVCVFARVVVHTWHCHIFTHTRTYTHADSQTRVGACAQSDTHAHTQRICRSS